MSSKGIEYKNSVEKIVDKINMLKEKIDPLEKHIQMINDKINYYDWRLSFANCENTEEFEDIRDSYIRQYRDIRDRIKYIEDDINEAIENAKVVYNDVIQSIKIKNHNIKRYQGNFGNYNSAATRAISTHQSDINELKEVLLLLRHIDSNWVLNLEDTNFSNVYGLISNNGYDGRCIVNTDNTTYNSLIGQYNATHRNVIGWNIVNHTNSLVMKCNNEKELDAETKYKILKTVVLTGEKLDSDTKYRYVMSQVGREYLQATYGWSTTITNNIRRIAEADIYAKANLKEVCINGNYYLIPNEFSLSWQTNEGESNLIRLSGDGKKSNVRNPVDSNGEKFYYHHIGQKQDSPIALLLFKDHGSEESYSEIHDTNIKESEINRKAFEVQKKEVINNDLLSHYGSDTGYNKHNSFLDNNKKSANTNFDTGKFKGNEDYNSNDQSSRVGNKIDDR